jgi:hypothetical protein
MQPRSRSWEQRRKAAMLRNGTPPSLRNSDAIARIREQNRRFAVYFRDASMVSTTDVDFLISLIKKTF